MKLTDRTILITGGSSGIGLEAAWQLLARGSVVIVTGRDRVRLDQAASRLPGLHTIQSDVADPDAIRALHAEVIERFPSLDVLVNNAGIMRKVSLLADQPLEALTRGITVNLQAPMQMVQQFLPDLLGRREALIVNVTSGLAFVPFKIAPAYSATKAGLHAYATCLRAQLAGTSVTVVDAAPPGTETPLLRGEFEAEMVNQKGMPVATLIKRMIQGIEAGQSDIRPGLARVLWLAGRLAPNGQRISIPSIPKALLDSAHAYCHVDFRMEGDVPVLEGVVDYRYRHRSIRVEERGPGVFSLAQSSVKRRAKRGHAAFKLLPVRLSAFEALGAFSCDIYWFNRRVVEAVAGLTEKMQDTRREISHWSGGPMLYRYGFRILPYGDPSDDWLALTRSPSASPGSS